MRSKFSDYARRPLPSPSPSGDLQQWAMDLVASLDENLAQLEYSIRGTGIDLGTEGYKDLTSSVSGAKVPPANAPTATSFGPAHTPQRLEFAFAVNDYVFIEAFHVDHDIKPNSLAYPHVHWSTNGTNTGNVKWELTIMRALGHQQAAFGTPTVVFIEQAAVGTAWEHMVAEDTTGVTMYEPDELILVTLRRVAASSSENTDTVFGLTVDFHYQSDRETTPQRAPDFYEEN